MTLPAEVTSTPTPTTTPTPVPTQINPPVPSSTPTTIPTPTSNPSGALFGWVYEGELRQGAADAVTFVLPDGTYRQFWQQNAASSTDGIHWTEEGKALPNGALGRVVQLLDGRYRIYSGAGDLIAFTSVDGKTWQQEDQKSLLSSDPGNSGARYSLGDVAIMPDKSYRMYYEQREPSAMFVDTGVTHIASATSKDGLVWQKDPAWRSDVFVVSGATGAGAAHPCVITLTDGTYKMFYWISYAIYSATSKDGQTWTDMKNENVFGADPDALLFPDGRIVLFVNWRDNSNGGQHMWTYVWQQVPFAFSLPPPTEMTLHIGETVSRSFSITGATGKDVRFSVMAYLSSGVFTANDPASPVEIRLDVAPGNMAGALSATRRQGSSPAFGAVIITADDGNIRVTTSILINISLK